MLKYLSQKIFDRKMLERDQELKYIKSFQNEWQFKGYQASLQKHDKKALGAFAIGVSALFGYTNIIPYIVQTIGG